MAIVFRCPYWTTAGILLLMLPFVASAQEATPSITQLIDNLDAAEHVLESVHIENFSLIYETRAVGSPWETSKFTIEGHAWYNGLPNSKARVQVTRHVMKSEKTSNPWLEVSHDLSFDGVMGRQIEYKSGAPGQLTASHTGFLCAGAPPALRDRYQAFADGTAFSLNFYNFDGTGRRLSQVFRDAILRGWKPQISWDSIYGDRTLRVAEDDRNAVSAIWLDAVHGYALRKVDRRRRESAEKAWIVQELTEIPRIVEAGPAIWFPLTATRIEPQPGKPADQVRMSFHASKVVANDPAFDESVFTIPLPARYWITDRVAGKVYYTSDPKATAVALDATVQDLKRRKASVAAPPSIVPSPNADSAGRPKWWGMVIVFVCVATAIGVILSIKRRRGAPLIFFSAVCFAVGAAQAQSPTSKPVADAPQENCGVNASYFIMKWFGREIDIIQVARELRAGDLFQRACSLKDLSDLYSRYGLTAAAMKGDSLGDVLQAIPQDSLAVVRLNLLVAGANVPHFVVLVPVSDRYYVVDPPGPPLCITTKEALAHDKLKRATGDFLLASAPNVNKRAGPAIQLDRQEIDLGRIPVGSNKFTAKVAFTNVGTQTLRILETRTTCSCMETPQGDTELEPGTSGHLEVTFDRAKVSPGKNRRTILIGTNDPVNPHVTVAFAFELAVTPLPSEVDVVPRSVDYGRTSVRGVIDRPLNITLRIPLKQDTAVLPAVRIETSSPMLRVEPLADDVVSSRSDKEGKADGITTMKYQARWLAAPKTRDINEHIQLTISRTGTESQKIDIPLRGEVLPDNRH